MAKRTHSSRLPAAFIGKPTNPLKRRKTGNTPFRRLPFHSGPRSRTLATSWAIPATGGYPGGYETGEAMALAFLKALRSNPVSGSCLASIAHSWMVRFEEEGGVAMAHGGHWQRGLSYSSLRGQYVGFCNTLEKWLVSAAQHLGQSLDAVDEADLIARANEGLGFDGEAYMASLDDGDRVPRSRAVSASGQEVRK